MKTSSVLSMVEAEPDLYTGSGSATLFVTGEKMETQTSTGTVPDPYHIPGSVLQVGLDRIK